MSNWCLTDYCFYADTDRGEEQLKKLYTALDRSISNKKRVIKSDFGDTWLGNVILEFCPQYLALTSDSIVCNYNNENIRFRGSIVNLTEPEEFKGDMFQVSVETAWEPMTEMWDMILAECRFDEVAYVYEAEEPGEGLYINSDTEGRFFADRFYIDLHISDDFYCYHSEYFTSSKEALAFLNEVITNLRKEYTDHPEKYNLPDGYTPQVLRKQKGYIKALKHLEENLFSSGKDESYITCHKFTSG